MSHILLAALLSAAAPAQACSPLPGIDAVLARPGLNYLLMGEYHGTVEMPAITGDALCAAVQKGRPVILGIEFPPANQPFLDAYLKSNGNAKAKAALLKAPAWAEEGGRTTAAIFDLIEQARRFAKARHKVSVAAFDLVPTPILSREREAALARGLSEAQARVPGSLVIALTGAGHAGKSEWSSQNPPFPATGQLLPQDATIALSFTRPGGQFWGCAAIEGAQSCKAQDMPAREPVAARGIRLDATLRDGFDGLYSAGAAYTASRPARPTP